MLAPAVCIVGAFAVGSIPFGFLIARARGIDIRQHGSKNIGATNVGRVLGRTWGMIDDNAAAQKEAIKGYVDSAKQTYDGLIEDRTAASAELARLQAMLVAGEAPAVGSRRMLASKIGALHRSLASYDEQLVDARQKVKAADDMATGKAPAPVKTVGRAAVEHNIQSTIDAAVVGMSRARRSTTATAARLVFARPTRSWRVSRA